MLYYYNVCLDIVRLEKRLSASRGEARRGKARQGKARRGKARQGKARQGKAMLLYDLQKIGDYGYRRI